MSRLTNTALSLFLAVAALSLSNLAAQNNPNPNTPAGGIKAGLGIDPIVVARGIEAGDYNFTQYDKTKINELVIGEIFKRSEKDKEYFLNSVKDIEGEIQSVIEQVMKAEPNEQTNNPGGLAYWSNKTTNSASGEMVTAFKLQDAINNFEAAKRRVQAKMKALSAISNGALPSKLDITMENDRQVEVPNFGNVNLQPLIDYYNEVLKGLTDYSANLPMKVIYPNGNPDIVNKGEGRTLTLKTGLYTLSPADIERFNTAIKAPLPGGLVWENYLVRAVPFSNFAKQFIQKFIEEFGTAEKWRIQFEDQKAARKQWANDIAEIFWLRSYLRARYHIQLGIIGMVYDRNSFNADLIFTKTKSLFKFQGEIGFDQKTLVTYEIAYRNILRSLKMKSTRVTGKGQADQVQDLEGNDAVGAEEDLSERIVTKGDTTLLDKGVGLLTWLNGNRPLADSGLMMVRLLAADMYEEKLIAENRHEEMVERYTNRYFQVDEDFDYFGKLEAKTNDITAAAAESTWGKFYQLRAELFQVQIALKNAKEAQKNLMLAGQLGNDQGQSDIDRQREERRKKLKEGK